MRTLEFRGEGRRPNGSFFLGDEKSEGRLLQKCRIFSNAD